MRLSIRNRLCFKELESLNRKGKLLCKHPLLQHYSLQTELRKQFSSNPVAFMEEYVRAKGNVARYQSYLNNPKKGTKEQREGFTDRLEEYAEKLVLMEEIVKEVTG